MMTSTPNGLMWFDLYPGTPKTTKIVTCRLPVDTVNDFQKLMLLSSPTFRCVKYTSK